VLRGRYRFLTKCKTPSTDRNGSVLYWMSRDQRVEDNHAMLLASQLARDRDVPVHVCFNLVPKFLDATLRQYHFMIEGLKETEIALRKKGIPFHLLKGDCLETVPDLAKKLDCCAVVTDMSPLRVPVMWSEGVGSKLDKDFNVPLYQVDAHNVVPVWKCSEKQEYAARTIRKKVHQGMAKYFTEFPELQSQTFPSEYVNMSPIDWDAALEELEIDRKVKPVTWIKPGYKAAMENLISFCSDGRLRCFADKRNDPNIEHCASNLSPYTHFGQISNQRCAIVVKQYALKHSSCSEGAKAFIEESVVRRELSDNFCFYNPNYDSVKGTAGWAQETLQAHAKDVRDYVYDRKALKRSKTHDPLWNAAQTQLRVTGKMHGFLRMYWAKKILEWSTSPEQALADTIYLNDRYSLDGRDPNGYVGCMWSICGVHDMGWKERPIFGKIRYMNYNGCKRKFKVKNFELKWGAGGQTSLNRTFSSSSKKKKKIKTESEQKRKKRKVVEIPKGSLVRRL
jgi:deoxyribodipyrimidine photo-lyase